MYKDINSIDSFFDKEDDANFFKGLPRKPENFDKVETFTDRFGQTYEAGIINNIAFKLDDEFQKEVVEQAKEVDEKTNFNFTEPSKDFQVGDDALLDYHRNTITSDNVLFEKDDKGNMSPTTVFIRGIKNPDDPNSPIYSVPGYVDGKKDYTERELQDIAKEKGWFSIYPSDPDSATHMARVNRVKNVINADGEKLLSSQRTGVDKTVDVIKDTGQGIATGIEKGVRQLNQAALSVAGLPADFANFTIKTLTGDKDFKGPIPNTEDLKQSFEKITNWASKYLPDVSTDNIKRNYRNETYGNIIEGISQFTAGAVPAAKAVGVTKTLYGTFAPSPIVRAMAWGAIADATTLMPQDSLQNIIAESLKSIPKEERGNVSNIVVSALQVNPKNAELVERIRGSTSGALVGAAIDKFIIPLAKSIIKVAKEAPWEELD